MRKVFIVFEIEDGVLTPHDHPVFTGEVAYDLQQEQEIQVNPDYEVREFTSENEINAAIVDYMREHVGEGVERIAITPFIVLPVMSVDVPNARPRKAKSVRGVQPKKTEKKTEPKK